MSLLKPNSLFQEARLVYAQSAVGETPHQAARKLAEKIQEKDTTKDTPIDTAQITEKAGAIAKKIDGPNSLTAEQKNKLHTGLKTLLDQQRTAIVDNRELQDQELQSIVDQTLKELEQFERTVSSTPETRSLSGAVNPVSEWPAESRPRVETGTYTVNTQRSNLNLRDPNTGAVIGSLSKGEAVKVTGDKVYRIDIGNPEFKKNQFVEVEYNGKKGLCALGYLKKSAAHPLPEVDGSQGTKGVKQEGADGGVREGEPLNPEEDHSGQEGEAVEAGQAADSDQQERQERQARAQAVEHTRPGRERVPGGAAKLGQMPQLPAEDLETLDRFTMDEKWEMLQSVSEGVEITPEQERRLEQLDMLQTLLDALSKETEDAKSMKMKFAKGAFWLGIIDDKGAMQQFRDEIAQFSSEIPAIKGQLLHGKTLKDVVPQQLFDAIKGLSENWLLGREEAVGFNFESDLKSEDEVTQQYSILVEFLRGWSRYDEAEKIMERRLDAVFKDKMTQLDKTKKVEATEEADEYAGKMTAKYTNKWRDDLMNSPEYNQIPRDQQGTWLGGQLEAIRQSLLEEKLDTLMHRAVAMDIKKSDLKNPTDQKMWEQYDDMLDAEDTVWNWNIQDATWDTIWEEVAINAPLIVLSGGVAAGVRAGATALARRVAGRYALKQAGITAAKYTGKELAGAGARVLGSSLKRKAAGYVAGKLLEGAAFEVAHLGLTGDLLRALQEDSALQWCERILWSSATLGLFHEAGRLGQGIFAKTIGKTRLNKYIEKISHPAVKEACRQLLVKGHVEAAGMMFIGAVQHMAYGGSFKDLGEDFVDNLVHAYISVGSLKVAGGVIHAGPRQWKGKKAKQAESAPRTAEEIRAELQAREGRSEEIQQKTASGKDRLTEIETEISDLQNQLDSLPRRKILDRRKLSKKIEKLTRERQKLQTKDSYLEEFRKIDKKALEELQRELEQVANVDPKSTEMPLSPPEVSSVSRFKDSIKKVAGKVASLVSRKSQSQESVTASDLAEVTKEMETVKAEAQRPTLSSRVKEYMSSQVGRLSRVFEKARSTLSRSEIGRAKREIKFLEIEQRRAEIETLLGQHQADRTLIEQEFSDLDSNIKAKNDAVSQLEQEAKQQKKSKKEARKERDQSKEDKQAVDTDQGLRAKEIRHCWEVEKKVYNERRLTLREDLKLVSAGINPETSQPFYELVSGDAGRNFDAHGIAKSGQLTKLLNLLEKGIYKGKEFSTAPFELRTEERASGSATGTAGGTCYKDGIAVVTSGYHQSLQEHGIKHVFINDVYAELKDPLKKLFPQYEIHLLSEQKAALEKDLSDNLSKTTSERPQQRHEKMMSEARRVSELSMEQRIVEIEKLLKKPLTEEQKQWIEEIHEPGHPIYQEVGEAKGVSFMRNKTRETAKVLGCSERQALELIRKGYLGAMPERVVIDKAMEKWQKGDRITQLRQKLDNILGRNHEDYRKDASRNLIMIETRELSGVIEQCKRDISEYNRRLGRGAEYEAVKQEFQKSSKVSPPKKSSDGTLQVKTAEGSFIIFDAESCLYTKIPSATGQLRALALENPALTARKKVELEQLVERAETRLDILKRTQLYESGDLKERIYYQGIELQGKKTLMIRNQEIIKNYQEQKAKLSKKSDLEKIDSEIARLRKEVDANREEADSMQHDIDQMTDRMLKLEDSFKPHRSDAQREAAQDKGDPVNEAARSKQRQARRKELIKQFREQKKAMEQAENEAKKSVEKDSDVREIKDALKMTRQEKDPLKRVKQLEEIAEKSQKLLKTMPQDSNPADYQRIMQELAPRINAELAKASGQSEITFFRDDSSYVSYNVNSKKILIAPVKNGKVDGRFSQKYYQPEFLNQKKEELKQIGAEANQETIKVTLSKEYQIKSLPETISSKEREIVSLEKRSEEIAREIELLKEAQLSRDYSKLKSIFPHQLRAAPTYMTDNSGKFRPIGTEITSEMIKGELDGRVEYRETMREKVEELETQIDRELVMGARIDSKKFNQLGQDISLRREQRAEELNKRREESLKSSKIPEKQYEKVEVVALNDEIPLDKPRIVQGKNGKIAFGTDKGVNYGNKNEDAQVINTEKNAFASIDGMGGMGHGDKAAKILAEEMQKGFQEGISVPEIQIRAHQRMNAEGVGEGGACYIAGKITGNRLNAWQAGDVRLLVIGKDGRIRTRTADENIYDKLIAEGKSEAEAKKYGNLVTNAVQGVRPGEAKYSIRDFELQPGDRIIAASDGLFDNLTNEQVAAIMHGRSIAEAIKGLNDSAKAQMRKGNTDNSKPDNINVIIYDFERAAPPQSSGVSGKPKKLAA